MLDSLGGMGLRHFMWKSTPTGMASVEADLLMCGGRRVLYHSGASMHGRFSFSQKVRRSSGRHRFAVRP